MARETVYMLQTVELSGGRTFRFDRPVLFKDYANAEAVAQSAVAKAGVIVHEVTGDHAMANYENPIVVFTAGMLPVGLLDDKETIVRLRQTRVVPAPAQPAARLQSWPVRPSTVAAAPTTTGSAPAGAA